MIGLRDCVVECGSLIMEMSKWCEMVRMETRVVVFSWNFNSSSCRSDCRFSRRFWANAVLTGGSLGWTEKRVNYVYRKYRRGFTHLEIDMICLTNALDLSSFGEEVCRKDVRISHTTPASALNCDLVSSSVVASF